MLLSAESISDCKPTLGKLQILRSRGGKKVFIIKRLACDWTVIGDLLEFDDSGTQVSIVEKQHRGEPEACCRAIFQHWLNGFGVRPCSWGKLIELLYDCDHQVLAQEVEAALSA